MSSAYVPPPKSQYEIERDERIARNEAFMRSLGLGGGLAAVVPSRQRPAATPRRKRPRDAEPREGERKSGRLAGEAAPDLYDVERDALAEADAGAPARRSAHFRVPRGSRLMKEAAAALDKICGEASTLDKEEAKAAKEAAERLDGEWSCARDCRQVLASIPGLRRPLWLKSLENSEILSTKSDTHTDKVMIVLERCAAGIGLGLPHWPDRARLCDGSCPLTLGSDTELLKYCGKRLEVVHGEDTSNGWAYTHALGKLKAYQALLVTDDMFVNTPLADLEDAKLEKLMPPLALDRDVASPSSKPPRVTLSGGKRREPDASPDASLDAAAAPVPMDVSPPAAAEPAEALLAAERRVLAEPEASEAPPAPDAPAPAPAAALPLAARPDAAVEPMAPGPAAAGPAPAVTPVDAAARLAEMEAKAKERFSALDAEDAATRQRKRDAVDAKRAKADAKKLEAATARKAAAAAKKEASEEEDAPEADAEEEPEAEEAAAPVETEVVMRKMNPFIYFSQQKRAAVKVEAEAAAAAEATPQERNRAVLSRIGVMWKALSDAEKQTWKDAAPEKETTVKKKKAKKAPKATAEAAADDAAAEEEPVETEVVMRKMNPFIYFSQQKRAAVKVEVEATAADEATPQERNREVVSRLGALWKALSDDEKQTWKDEAPEKEATVKKKKEKAPKAPKAPKELKHLFQSKPDGKKQTSMMSFFM